MLLKEYYWFFRKALSNEVCDKIIEAGLRRPKLKGTVGNSKDVDVVEKTTRHSVVSWLDDNWIYNLLHPYIQLANTNAGWNFEWDYSEPMQFTVYKKNQFYTWHADQRSAPYPNDYSNENYRNKIRKLSVTVQLSDSKDYTGGELEFDLRHNKENKAKHICRAGKEKGTIIVFPSFVWHRVRPVKKGTRKSLVIWSLGRSFK
jgi:PKHD-type hydroxylase